MNGNTSLWAERLGRILGFGPTTADVLWCYRTLLNREPESEAVIRAHMRHGGLRSLIKAFVTCDEFRFGRAPPAFRPMPLPTARVDVRVDAARLAAATALVRATWSQLGQDRPHFSVMTNEHFLPQNLPGSIDLFWASGDSEADQVKAILASHQVVADGKVCIEYGCGVGRVTGGLVRWFEHVHAFDISPGHLALAEQRLASLEAHNVTLALCPDTVTGALPPCDVYYSRLVLQHNPPPVIDALVRAALAALKSGGVAIFQVPTYADGYSFDIDAWLRAGVPPDMEMHCLPQPWIFKAIADAGCVPLELREDGSTGDGRFISNVFVVQRPSTPSAADTPVA